jgi:hypothetical protein
VEHRDNNYIYTPILSYLSREQLQAIMSHTSETSNPPVYQHTKLPSGSSTAIRLLVLRQFYASGHRLEGDIIDVSLEEAEGHYVALSYCWGSESKPESLHLPSGEVMKLTANCAAGLWALRDDLLQLCWVDAICIDQSSEEERSQQVKIMGDIYKYAGRVCVWLGESEERTWMSFRLLEDWASRVQSSDDKVRLWEQFLELRDVKHNFPSKESHSNRAVTGAEASAPAVEDNAREDILQILFRKAWFSRVWTLQETIIPSPEKVVVVCGSRIFPWTIMLCAAISPWFVVADANTMETMFRRCAITNSIHSFLDIDTSVAPKAGPMGINESMVSTLSILQLGRDMDTKDDKDRIYSLYGILKHKGHSIPEPDYSKSVEDIFADATLACIQNDGCLDFLYLVPSLDRLPGLGSWVVDWKHLGWRGPMWPGATRRYAESSLRNERISADSWRLDKTRKIFSILGKVVTKVVNQVKRGRWEVEDQNGGQSGKGHRWATYNTEIGLTLAHSRPARLESGDVIIVLRDLDLPIVARAAGDCWQFLTWMDGVKEIWAIQDKLRNEEHDKSSPWDWFSFV